MLPNYQGRCQTKFLFFLKTSFSLTLQYANEIFVKIEEILEILLFAHQKSYRGQMQEVKDIVQHIDRKLSSSEIQWKCQFFPSVLSSRAGMARQQHPKGSLGGFICNVKKQTF